MIAFLPEKMRFRISSWLGDEEFRELLEFSNYIGRDRGASVFELDPLKMKRNNYTLRDVYAKLSSIESVNGEDLESLKKAYLEEFSVEVKIGYDGLLRVSSRAPLKEFFQNIGIVPPYSPSEKAFKVPAHLYYKITSELSKRGFNVIDELDLTNKTLPRKISFNGALRDYQKEALEAWAENGYRGVLALPTGSGKTVIAVAGVAMLCKPALIVVYTKDHIRQWAEAFKKFTDASGLVGAYYGEEKRLSYITITTYQTAFRKVREFAPHFPLIVFDEAHHLPAEKFKAIAFRMPAPYRLGLSATPEREDGKHEEIFPLAGGVVYVKTPSELAEKGYLAPFIIRKVKVKLLGEEREKYETLRKKFQNLTGGRSFQELLEAAKKGDRRAVEALKIHAAARNIIQYSESKLKAVENIIKEELARGGKIIVFTQYKDQAEEIGRKVNGYVLHGDLGDKERETILRQFKGVKSGVLVVTTVGDEGLDIPDANVGVFVSGTGSRRQFIQRLGRLLRPAPGKRAVLYEVIVAGTSEEFQSRRRRELV